MTAAQWLELRFPDAVSGEFTSVAAGDVILYDLRVPGRPTMAVVTNTDLFLEWFGPTIQAAMDNDTSVYEALKALPPEQQRGFDWIWDLWQAKGFFG